MKSDLGSALLRATDVARLLAVHPKNVYRIRGLPRVRIGGALRWRPEDIEQFLREQRETICGTRGC